MRSVPVADGHLRARSGVPDEGRCHAEELRSSCGQAKGKQGGGGVLRDAPGTHEQPQPSRDAPPVSRGRQEGIWGLTVVAP
jgi:hypothetical protein